MNTIVKAIPEMSIEEFAEQHGLTMEINERRVEAGSPSRYYASFNKAEVKGDGVLISSFGNGRTPEEAIQNYAQEIHLKRIVIDAFKPTRREIEVPRLRGVGDR